MSLSYKQLAWERAVIARLQRFMLETLIESDSRSKERVVSEDLFVNEAEVPQDELLRVFSKMEFWENFTRTNMSTFSWTQSNDSPPFIKKKKADEPAADKKDKPNEQQEEKPHKKKRPKQAGAAVGKPQHDAGEPSASGGHRGGNDPPGGADERPRDDD